MFDGGYFIRDPGPLDDMTPDEVAVARRRLMHLQKQMVIICRDKVIYASKKIEAEYISEN